MTDQRSEEDRLVQRAAQSDDEAFCILRDRYRQHLRVLVARYAPNPADADDMYAEIIARLLADNKRALRQWRPVAPFSAYLTAIAVRHCLSWLERNSRRPSTVELHFADPETNEREMLQEIIECDAAERPDRVLAQREQRVAIATALMELSERDRLVLALRFDQGMSGPEIGRALGISAGAARQRIFKALRRLNGVLSSGEDADLFLTGQ